MEVGDKVRIIDMKGEPQYANRTGEITHIDDEGKVFGTWGGCAIIPSMDKFEIIERRNKHYGKHD